MSSSQQKTLEDFIQLENRNAISHVIRTLVDLGVIERLREGQRTTEQLAAELKIFPFALKQLLDVGVQTELIEKYGEDYALTTIARLIPERFLDLGDRHWQHLKLYAQTGAPLPICDEVAETDRDYIEHKSSEEWTWTPAALTAAKALDMGGVRKGISILEVNCGSAVFGVTLAHADEGSRLTLVDDSIGIERAQTTVKSVGLENVTYVTTDNTTEFASLAELKDREIDLVILAGQVHRMTGGDCQRLFQEIYSLMGANSELAVIDVFPGQERGDLTRAIFELELGLRTSRGRLHHPRMLETILKETGFGQVQFAHLPVDPFYWGLVLAQRD